MSIHQFPSRDDRLDDAIVAAMQDLLTPPGGEAFWSSLEGSIMARLDTADFGWWGELTRWTRPALAAAAALVIVAGAAMLRTSEVEAHAVFEQVAMNPVPEDLTVLPAAQGDREETLRFLIDE